MRFCGRVGVMKCDERDEVVTGNVSCEKWAKSSSRTSRSSQPLFYAVLRIIGRDEV
jgi:hypothetical protein